MYDGSIVLCIDGTQFVVNDSGMSLSDRFKQVLSGRTKADIARDSGVAPQTLSNWLSRGSIPAKHLFRVAESLSVSPQWLSTGKGSMTQSNIAAVPSNLDSPSSIPDIASLMSNATPRTTKALEEINQAALSGKLSESDVELLNELARKLSND